MPIIEFYCSRCQHKFEELILNNDEPNSIKCPKCKNSNLEKLYSSFSFSSSGGFSSNIGSSCTGCLKDTCTDCSK
ncbi:zinc ribbon domain-containing protein [candidate division WOR-3 bacterium]|nr:zinc ribbon domain-containing protein [candidate division WOR-3 bacterium]